MSLARKQSLPRIFLFSALGGLVYFFAASEATFLLWFELFEARRWIPLLVLPLIFGGAIGLGMAYSVLLCLPEMNTGKNRLLMSAVFGGIVLWASMILWESDTYIPPYLGLIIFALSLGLCGDSMGVRMKVGLGVVIGFLLGLELHTFRYWLMWSLYGAEWARSTVPSDYSKVGRLAIFLLQGYLTNLGLLLGFYAQVKFVWYGAALGFVVMGLDASLILWRLVLGVVIGGAIGYFLDWRLRTWAIRRMVQ